MTLIHINSLLLSLVALQCISFGEMTSEEFSGQTGSRICEAVWDLFGFGWWLAGAIVLTTPSNQADDAGRANSSYRAGVLAMAWLSMALFFLMFMINVIMVVRMKKTLRSANRDVAKDVKGGPNRVATAV